MPQSAGSAIIRAQNERRIPVTPLSTELLLLLRAVAPAGSERPRFDIRERFFHIEFFRTEKDGGRLIALEANMRPPGGLTTDMFNYANDIDIYAEWANIIVHNEFTSTYSRPYHCCYVGRKTRKGYLHSHEEILSRYGHRIAHHERMSPIFSRAMGDYCYLIRSPDLDETLAIAHFIQRLE